LELALHVLGIGLDDEVITTSRTFMATASAILMKGAKPIFADVDSLTQNISAETIRPLITSKTKAIIAVHLAGWPCDMDPIVALAKEHDLKVIEDCAQAHGAKYKGQPVGSLGDIAAFSFCQDKILTTGGEGGMLVTNDRELWEKAWAFKDHGKDYDTVFHKEHAPGFRWLHNSFGSNYRMTEMQAAIGRVCLRKLDTWVDIRRKNVESLSTCFLQLDGLEVMTPPSEIFHSYYKYYTFVREEKLKSNWDRDRIMNEINGKGIPCFSGSCSEIYLEKVFQKLQLQPSERLPNAKRLGETSLMFLVDPSISLKSLDKTKQLVKQTLEQAIRG